MDLDRAALVRSFADLAGRPIDDLEAGAVIEHADALTHSELNALWQQERRARHTVAFRDYLALTLRFTELGETMGRGPETGRIAFRTARP